MNIPLAHHVVRFNIADIKAGHGEERHTLRIDYHSWLVMNHGKTREDSQVATGQKVTTNTLRQVGYGRQYVIGNESNS